MLENRLCTSKRIEGLVIKANIFARSNRWPWWALELSSPKKMAFRGEMPFWMVNVCFKRLAHASVKQCFWFLELAEVCFFYQFDQRLLFHVSWIKLNNVVDDTKMRPDKGSRLAHFRQYLAFFQPLNGSWIRRDLQMLDSTITWMKFQYKGLVILMIRDCRTNSTFFPGGLLQPDPFPGSYLECRFQIHRNV